MSDLRVLPARRPHDRGFRGPLGLDIVELGRPSAATAPTSAEPAPTAWVDVVHVGPARVVIVLAECPDHLDAGALVRLRAGANAVAGLDLPPDVMLQRMDEYAGECGVGFPVSMVIAVVDAVRATMRLVCAGAPPPLILKGDEVTPVPATVGPPVGLGAAYPHADEQPLTEDVVIAFATTLGLAAGRDSVSQLREVATVLDGHRESALGELVDDLVHASHRHAMPAPITLVRLTGDRTFAAHWQLPATTSSATRGRHLIDGTLVDWPGSTVAMRHDVRLVATEVLSRVLTTATGPVTLRLALTGDGILIEAHGVEESRERGPRPTPVIDGDVGRALICDLSTRCGHRWEFATPRAWAQVPWTASSTVREAATTTGAVGA